MDEDRATDFDNLAEAYERMAGALPLREHVEAHTLFALLGDIGGRAVLDLGCGSGLCTRRLCELGAATVTGIDFSIGPAARDGAEAPAVMKVPGFDEFPLLPYRWSRRTYEDALHEAGFATVTWVRPQVSAEGVATYGEAHWANYLKIPHALYVDCTA